jgi:hypothetical protein
MCSTRSRPTPIEIPSVKRRLPGRRPPPTVVGGNMEARSGRPAHSDISTGESSRIFGPNTRGIQLPGRLRRAVL